MSYANQDHSSDSVPYGHYNVYVMLTGDDLTTIVDSR
jgi:hypothetical protein